MNSWKIAKNSYRSLYLTKILTKTIFVFSTIFLCTPFLTNANAESAIAISSGNLYSCVITGGGGVKCWGAGGALGDGSGLNRSIPVDVIGLTSGVKSIATGSYHACALSNNGTVSCWGSNGYGALGDGTNTSALRPVTVIGLTGVVAIAAGTDFTCALLSTHSVRCWGINTTGQLGDATSINKNTPTTVIGLVDAISIAAGAAHVCVTTSASGVKCWGSNLNGAFGNGTLTSSNVPTLITGYTDAVQLTAGNGATCARTITNQVKCSGFNTHGQQAQNSIVGNVGGTLVPTIIPGATNIASVSMSPVSEHVCAVSTTGIATCWGWNIYRQLGSGDQVDKYVPTVVQGLTAGGGVVSSISAGRLNTCAILQSAVECWGYNNVGQLGNNTIGTFSTPPVDVYGLSGGAPTDFPTAISPVTSSTPTYKWLPSPGSTSYNLKIDGIVTVVTAITAGCETGIGICKFTGLNLPDGIHNWSVQGFNQYGAGQWSANLQFKI